MPRIVVTKDSATSFYRGYHQLFKKPHYVSPALTLLCGTPSPEVVAKAKAATGPHFEALVQIHTNDSAFRAIDLEKFPFPVGSVVVKEKIGALQSVIGVGGMIKREAGYDPANGDWEYFYSDTKDQFVTGKLRNCSECHARAKQTDYVFSRSEPSPSLKGGTRK